MPGLFNRGNAAAAERNFSRLREDDEEPKEEKRKGGITGLTQAVGAKVNNLKSNITHQFRKGKETVVDARNKVADYSLEKTTRAMLSLIGKQVKEAIKAPCTPRQPAAAMRRASPAALPRRCRHSRHAKPHRAAPLPS